MGDGLQKVIELKKALSSALNDLLVCESQDIEIDIEHVKTAFVLKSFEAPLFSERLAMMKDYKIKVASLLKTKEIMTLISDGTLDFKHLSTDANTLYKDIIASCDNAILASSIWDLIKKGVLNAGSDAIGCKAIVKQALESTDERRIINLEDDEQYTNISPAETFLLNLAFSTEDPDIMRTIAMRMSQECDPRLMYTPSASPKRFQGSLLEQIFNQRRNLSPAIINRRELGIVFENSISRYHKYVPFEEISEYCIGALGAVLSVELPHLTFALVEKVEVTVEVPVYRAANNITYVSAGTGIMMRPFVDLALNKKDRNTETMILSRVLKPEDQNIPCAHVSIGINNTPCTIVSVRLYGTALMW